MSRAPIMPRRARSVAFAFAIALASSAAHGQTPDDLRPGIGEDPNAVEEPPPVTGKVTTLEASPPVEEEPPPERRRRAPVEDPYAPLGLRLGSFTLFPKLGVAGATTDNVRRTEKDRISDVGLRLRPAARLESDWIRHSFEVEGSGDFTFYEKESDFDDAGAEADARLRLDVRHTTWIEFEGTYFLTQDSAADREVPDAAVQNRTDQNFGAFTTLSHTPGRLGIQLRGGASWQVYQDVKLEDGGVEDNSDRNYVQPEAGLRLSYESSPDIRPFVETAYVPRIHDKQEDRNGIKRDSEGYEAGVGVAFDVADLWSGEMALTYLRRNYEDQSLDTVDTFGLRGNVQWRPTELTTVRLNAETAIDDSSTPGVGGFPNYDARIEIAHALRDNVVLTAGAGFEYDDGEGDDDDITTRTRLAAAWQLNPWFAWTASYDMTWFDSSQASSDYLENRLSAGFEIRR